MAESGVCTTCGTALPDADVLGLRTCPKCGQVAREPASQGWPAPPIAAPHPGGQWTPPAGVAGAPPAPPSTPIVRAAGASGSSSSRSGRRLGCALVPMVLIVAFTLVVFGAIRSCNVDGVKSAFDPNLDPSSSMITISGSATVLPVDGDGNGADVVAIGQETEGSITTRTIARIAFTGEGSRLRWQSEPLDAGASRVEVAMVGDILFAGTDDALYALDADTGATRWKTTLRDKLTTGCPDCFAAVGGRLVVRTTDAYVTAYGPRSAEAQWTKRLNSTSGSMSVAGDRLFIVDDPEDAKALTPVTLVDPASGKVLRSTTPTCPDSEDSPWDLEMSAGDEVLAIPGSDDVVAVFGFGDGCVVRWAPASGAVRWTSRLTGLTTFDGDLILVGERDLVLGASGSALVTVYLPNGKARQLGVATDTEATPTQIVGRTLVALTATTRGTPRGGLAGWDLATGERSWANASLGTAEPVSTGPYHSSDALFDGSPRSLVVRSDERLDVFVFEGTNRTFTVAPLDIASGELGTEVRRAFLTRYDSGTVSLTVEGVSGDRLIVSIDNLLQSIPVSGRGDVVSFPAKN